MVIVSFSNSEGRLKFEGEYINGKKNGKGKEYKNCNLIYKGEYLNNKRNGKGKEYTLDGKLIFIGEYLEGNEWNGIVYDIKNQSENKIKNGKGFIRKYDEYVNLQYKGEYLNGKRHGKGKEYFNNGIYEGEYSNGKRHGKGKEYYPIYPDKEFMYESE